MTRSFTVTHPCVKHLRIDPAPPRMKPVRNSTDVMTGEGFPDFSTWSRIRGDHQSRISDIERYSGNNPIPRNSS